MGLGRGGLLLALVLVAAGAGLQHREALSAWLRPAVQGLAAAPAAAPAATAARKCVDRTGRVLYTTDAACPTGQREAPLDGPPLTVISLPAAPPSAPASVLMPLDRIDRATR